MHLILIPTYNERENIGALLDAVLVHADVHVLVIDDASPDGTADDVRSHTHFNDRVFLLAREGKEGLGAAYRAGFAWGMAHEYQTLTQMDADFSHHPSDVPRLLAAIHSGADVAIGSRKILGGRIEGWNAWRMFCSTGAMAASRICLGLRTKDVTAGFRTWRKEFVARLPVMHLQSNGYAFQEEMLMHAEHAGAQIHEIPVVFRDRARGVSKLGVQDIYDFFYTLIRLTFIRRERLLRYMCVGALGAFIDFSIFLVLHEGLGVQVLLANIFATICAVVHNFLWHHFVTFRAHGQSTSFALGVFVAVSLVGMVINSLVVLAGIALGLFSAVAKIFAIMVVTIWNYLMNSRITFRRLPVVPDTDPTFTAS